MKKFLGILVVGLGLLFIFKYTFSIKTYLKCEPYEQNSKEVLYFAFDCSTLRTYALCCFCSNVECEWACKD